MLIDGSEVVIDVPKFEPITMDSWKQYSDVTYDEVAKQWKKSMSKEYVVSKPYEFVREHTVYEVSDITKLRGNRVTTLQFDGAKIDPTPLADRLKELS